MDKQFSIFEVISKLGKISNNLEVHGDEEVVVFAIPVTGLVDESTANAIAGDRDFTRSVFNDNKGFLEPMPWVRSPIRMPEKYDSAAVDIALAGDEVLSFTDGRIGNIELMPMPGGMVQVDYQLQVRPDLDRTNLLLQEYQHREATITVDAAKIALKKKGKQKDLPLQQPPVEERELARSSEEELEAARQRDETERQLGEALRGLDAQKPVENVGDGENEAANDGDSGDDGHDSEAA